MFDLYPTLIKMDISQFPGRIDVTKFDIKSAIVSLSIDPIVMNDNNLLMNEGSYQNPTIFNNECYGDIHTGYWFKNAHAHLCNNEKDLLCSHIFFIDGVCLDSMGRQSLEPVTFTLGIFNRKARNSHLFWRILGYIPNIEKFITSNIHQSKQRIILKKFTIKKC